MKNDEIIVYTDGSSLGNPGRGGWASVLVMPEDKVRELGGRENESTNNRMEITAAIEALKFIEERKVKAKRIKIHTDSLYLLNGITMWIYVWVKNNWRTKGKDPVLNKDLWEILFKVHSNLKMKYEIDWIKVEGHAGVDLNERCDVIATNLAGEERMVLFTGDIKDYKKLFRFSNIT